MNSYDKKRRWKILLLLFAILIGIASLIYTNDLVRRLSEEEEKNMIHWARATSLLSQTPIQEIEDAELANFINEANNFAFDIVGWQVNIPMILTDSNDNIITHRNLDSAKAQNPEYLEDQLQDMKSEKEAIVINFDETQRNYLYYKDSYLLTLLRYYPFIQLSLITLFILVSYLAFSASRRSEQNQVWVGMSKETAHQLGTPISSLMAWLDVLKQDEQANEEILTEFEKDISRLELITERFSKIGSAPVLEPAHLPEVIQNAIDYLRSRTSSQVSYSMETQPDAPLNASINIPLFEWVIENLCKNAIDAMNGKGKISFHIQQTKQGVQIDMADTGKGVSKSKFKTIFKPGFTTKKRGWGLGLSLVKRIIETYHKGLIFVHASEPNKGTTFRIILKS